MPPKFGTSGVRGLVTELSPALVQDYTSAFLQACPTGGAVHLGWDLRESSPRIAGDVEAALVRAGADVIVHGVLPTPALALAALTAGQAAIMVTGSHIPADRNGLKFYVPGGEILKSDETAINACLGSALAEAATPGQVSRREGAALAAYAARYETGFGPQAMAGLRVGVYQHSSVARDVIVDVLQALGATAVPIARSDTFIPVDTEAVDPATRAQLSTWCKDHRLDALVSTDGDADRPMVTDARGVIVPGDVLGVLTAQLMGAGQICTPVSSNSMVDALFPVVDRTRIGSPFVIAAMAEAPNDASVVGYEANGGFLLGFRAQGPTGPLEPLMTRDCLLPILAPLALARSRGLDLAALVATLPPRFTAADRVQGIEAAVSGAFITDLTLDPAKRAAIFAETGGETGIDTTDGLRISFDTGAVVHLRPSGNAPETRCYAEADSPEAAEALVTRYLAMLKDKLTQ